MNIQLLLSGTPSQDTSSLARQPLPSQLESSQALFRQALSQASGAPSRLSQPTTADTGVESSPTLMSQLQSLGFELDEEELSKLLAQFSLADDTALTPPLALDTFKGEASTPLEEIAERLKLMASFSEDPVSQAPQMAPTLENIAQQLSISEEEAADLISALHMLIDPRQSSGAAESVAKAFNVPDAEIAKIKSALSTLMTEVRPSADNTAGNIQSEATSKPSPESPALFTSTSNSNQVVSNIFEGPSRQDPSRQALSQVAPVTHLVSDEAAGNTYYTKASYTPAASTNQLSAPVFTAQEAMAQLTPTPSTPLGVTVLEDHASSRMNPIAGGFQPPTQSGAPGTALPSFISTPVSSPAWPSQLGQQLVQFSQRGGDQQVKLQLHPAELGPLSITLKVTEQGTQAHFLSTHAQVRQVIEQAIPQLRETLAEQGISLGETSVGEQRNPQEQAFAQKGNGASASGGENGPVSDNDVATPAPGNQTLAVDGRVDLYA